MILSHCRTGGEDPKIVTFNPVMVGELFNGSVEWMQVVVRSDLSSCWRGDAAKVDAEMFSGVCVYVLLKFKTILDYARSQRL